MRIRTSIQLLAAISLVSTVAACGGGGRAHRDNEVVAVQWDSGPLDRDYQRQRADMEARHRDEVAHARADEAAEARDARQAAEKKDLEDRYQRAKEGHMNNLPPSNHDHDHDGDHH
jgi:hypothetical protein